MLALLLKGDFRVNTSLLHVLRYDYVAENDPNLLSGISIIAASSVYNIKVYWMVFTSHYFLRADSLTNFKPPLSQQAYQDI